MTRSARVRVVAAVTTVALLAGLMAIPVVAAPAAQPETASAKAVFFASDGLRQDLVAKYAAKGLMPTMSPVPQARHHRRPATAC